MEGLFLPGNKGLNLESTDQSQECQASQKMFHQPWNTKSSNFHKRLLINGNHCYNQNIVTFFWLFSNWKEINQKCFFHLPPWMKKWRASGSFCPWPALSISCPSSKLWKRCPDKIFMFFLACERWRTKKTKFKKNVKKKHSHIGFSRFRGSQYSKQPSWHRIVLVTPNDSRHLGFKRIRDVAGQSMSIPPFGSFSCSQALCYITHLFERQSGKFGFFLLYS